MLNKSKADLPEDPGGLMVGPPPGVYSSHEEYLQDMALGMPKLREALQKEKDQQANTKQVQPA